MKQLRLMLLFAILWLSASGLMFPQWNPDPAVNNAVCTAPVYQSAPVSVSDGAGGVIIAWIDHRSNEEVYIQRISSTGYNLWEQDGVLISGTSGHKSNLKIVSDGSGGAILAWFNVLGADSCVRSQRINAAGLSRWIAPGIGAIKVSFQDAVTDFDIASDGKYGALFSWAAGDSIIVQRIDSNGVSLWGYSGVNVCASQYLKSPKIAADGLGGGFTAWVDGRDPMGSRIYSQYVDFNGVIKWAPANGVWVDPDHAPSGTDFCKLLIMNDSRYGLVGPIIVWKRDDIFNMPSNIYTQQISTAGTRLWPEVHVANMWNYQNSSFCAVNKSSTEVYIYWTVLSIISGPHVFGQLIQNGTPAWGANGVTVCGVMGGQYNPSVSRDESGDDGTTITWQDARNSNYDIYVQKVGPDGSLRLAAAGEPVCTAASAQQFPVINSSFAGSSIITWLDGRDGSNHIYASKVPLASVPSLVPILYYPAEGDIVYSQTPHFSWGYPSGVTGLTSTIQIAADAGFTTGLQSATTTASSYTWGTALPFGGQFWWRVISKNAGGAILAYSAANHFTVYGSISLPVPTWPVGGATVYSNTPTIYWYPTNAVAGISFMYQYRKSGAAGWDRASAWTTDFSAVLPQLEPGSTYEWCVKSFNGFDSSAFSAPATFVTNGSGTLVVPIPSWPVNWGGWVPTVYTCSPEVYWYTQTGSAGLTFEVGFGEDPNPANWTAPVIPVLTGFSAVIPGLSCGHTYYWGVRSVNTSGHSAWSTSPEGKFTVYGSVASIKPTCSYPIGDATVYTHRPTLYWYSASPGISYYLLHYNAGSGWVDVPTHILPQSWTFDFDLANSTTYQWYVTAVNLSGEQAHSDVASFTTSGFEWEVYPICSFPIENNLLTTNNPTLEWFVMNPWLSNILFQVQVSTDPLFATDIVYDTAGIATSSKVVYSGIISGCSYYWRVRGSLDGGVTYHSWSTPVGRFRTDAGNAPVVVIAAGPANGMLINTTSPDLGWYQPVQSAAALTYTVQYATHPDFSDAVTVNNLSSPMYKANNLTAGTKYYWRVQSKTADGRTSRYSNTAAFIPVHTTGVHPDLKNGPAFALSQNYPNPFNPSTTISFSVPESGRVVLSIYNQLGQKVAELFNGEKQAGTHSIEWNAGDFVSGVYFYELRTEKFSQTKKLLLMK